MKTEYISIKDFAKRAGVSQQSLYKRLNKLNNQLNNYVKMVENQKMIDIRALQEVYGVEVEQPIQPKIEPVEQPIQPIIEPVEQPIQPNFDSILSQNQQMIDMLKEQLEAKDKQIENLQKLLDQEQHLNAMNHEKILLLESKLEEPTEPVEPDEEPPKGFFSRFFKK